MSGMDDLKKALTDLNSTIQALPGLISAMIAANSNGDDAAFEDAAKQVEDAVSGIKTATTAVVAAAPPAAAPPAAAPAGTTPTS